MHPQTLRELLTIRLRRSKTGTDLLWNLAAGIISGGAIFAASGIMVRNLGYSGFGIIAVWLALQTVIQILDFGLGSSLAREKSNSKESWGEMIVAARLFYVYVSLSTLFAAGVALFVINSIRPFDIVVFSVMACALAIQFNALLYTWILSGAERQKASSQTQMVGNLLRYGGAASVTYTTNNLLTFFVIQSAISVIILCIYRRVCEEHVPAKIQVTPTKAIQKLRPLAKHSTGMWMTSLAATALGVTDRTLVGAICSSEDLGKYSTSLIAANLLSLAILPFYRVYYAQFCRTFYEGENSLLSSFYRSSILLSMTISVIVSIAYFVGPTMLRIWIPSTDDRQIFTFQILIIGIGLSGLMWIPGALTQAIGKPSIHVQMIVGSLVVAVVASYFSVKAWGYAGAGVVWITHGLFCFIMEPAQIRRHYSAICLKTWYLKVGVLPIVLLFLVVDMLCRNWTG